MLLAKDAPVDLVLPLLDTAWASWVPREDKPEEFDEQSAYVYARDLVSFALGGNASGKTAASAKKCANFVLNQEPPRKDTPFWIISRQYPQSMGVCWKEKLFGQQFIPHCEIESSRIRWYDYRSRYPFAVPLKPWPNGNNWVLEFKSYEQGWEALQAFSIGGFWFSEQFPWDRFLEVLRGCRDYMFPGGQFCEFTPIDPELCVAIETMMDNPPQGWQFYRLNTERNRTNLAGDWYDQFFAAVPDEMLATRKTGALATFEGVIYQTFHPTVHVTDDDSMVWLPGIDHWIATDWGASAEHPFVTVWLCEDGMGDMIVFDEYWSISQEAITQDHAAEVLARSILWGWPEPPFFKEPEPRQREYVKTVLARVAELRAGMNGTYPRQIQDGYRHYGQNYADPSRPGEINAFGYWGVPTLSASNDVHKGIDLVRSRFKVNPITGRPRLKIHQRCKHTIEEHRKYRWVRTRPGRLWTTAAPRPIPLKKDDDCCDAVRYGVASHERDRGQAPSTASNYREPRKDILLDRAGNGHGVLRPMQAGASGWFRK